MDVSVSAASENEVSSIPDTCDIVRFNLYAFTACCTASGGYFEAARSYQQIIKLTLVAERCANYPKTCL
jgi:hypothetical protein